MQSVVPQLITFEWILPGRIIHPLEFVEHFAEDGTEVVDHFQSRLLRVFLEVLADVHGAHGVAQTTKHKSRLQCGVTCLCQLCGDDYLPDTKSVHSSQRGLRSDVPVKAAEYLSCRLRAASFKEPTEAAETRHIK